MGIEPTTDGVRIHCSTTWATSVIWYSDILKRSVHRGLSVNRS